MSFRFLNVVLVVAVTACIDDPRNQRPQEVLEPVPAAQHGCRSSEKLEFMVAPWLASNELIEIYTPLLANLSQTLEEPVRLNIAPDYPTLPDCLRPVR